MDSYGHWKIHQVQPCSQWPFINQNMGFTPESIHWMVSSQKLRDLFRSHLPGALLPEVATSDFVGRQQFCRLILATTGGLWAIHWNCISKLGSPDGIGSEDIPSNVHHLSPTQVSWLLARLDQLPKNLAIHEIWVNSRRRLSPKAPWAMIGGEAFDAPGALPWRFFRRFFGAPSNGWNLPRTKKNTLGTSQIIPRCLWKFWKSVFLELCFQKWDMW